MPSRALLSTGGGIPMQQVKLAPDGLEFSKDVSLRPHRRSGPGTTC